VSIWPFLPVWPFLMAGALLCSWWNWRAGLSFLVCLGLVRLCINLELKDPLVWRMVLYSVIAVVALFFVDRVAGGFFALISLSLVCAMLGVYAANTHVYLSEAILVLGMLASAVSGPSGGLLAPLHPSGRGSDLHMAPQHSKAPSEVATRSD